MSDSQNLRPVPARTLQALRKYHSRAQEAEDARQRAAESFQDLVNAVVNDGEVLDLHRGVILLPEDDSEEDDCGCDD